MQWKLMSLEEQNEKYLKAETPANELSRRVWLGSSLVVLQRKLEGESNQGWD
jgi:hypothetical protein